ncbi:MAG: hypothetical protein JNM69_15120 [Archangium sp.]|nr:hypothetical protein [Archangium sp.]
MHRSLLLLCACAASGLSPLTRGVRADATPGDVAACQDFAPPREQVTRFFSRARVVDVHEADVAACVVRGTIDGQPFELNALWSAERTEADGGVTFLKCDDC